VSYKSSPNAAPWRIFNIGCGALVELLRYIEVIEERMGRFVAWDREFYGR